MICLAIELDTAAEAADLVEALLAAADRAERRSPERAARLRGLADGIGDGLDALPRPARLSDDEVDELLAACGLHATA
ncbi:hypothetical protein GCM10010193_69730 [Kitasatospora atroaurantiaca]|uniref:Uncharacterized protein n=1 Tax=Kitasatospora atroaurantiaca TaxID=285545 RepID=A0A561EN71_9ACTN|nr:hypothetical protein [Kitasatospora atroaurantiaca]TWE17057.1 hypothetical protein FB465_2061 [Kitasatospora atroaurantiaca]